MAARARTTPDSARRVLLGVALGVAWSGAALAQAEDGAAPVEGVEAETPRAPTVTLHLEAASDAPILVGGMLSVELPGRLELGGGFGAVPDAYLAAVGEVVTSIGGLASTEADVVQSALEGRWAARAFVGWRPSPKAGFYLRFGYQALRLGGSLGASDALAMVTGVTTAVSVSGSVSATSTLHMLYGELGYRWSLDPVSIRLSLGFTGTVGSTVDITVDTPTNQALADQLAALGESYLQDNLRQYVMTPTIGLAIGYDIGL
ncbi:MAG: hypothetical protein H6730_07515 [Deltaproteobacteria bacterium]|nr:hypothetical protein [Deltaproteobacteria bacterium]